MRHRKSFNHLGRKSAHRKAMLANMASSLILHKRIKTTTAKAKALKQYIEPIITRSKDDSTHARRVVFSYLQDKEAVSELFREVTPKIGDRPGGYTRIIRLGARLGDSAEICLIELVDYNENLLAEKAASKKSSRRRRGGKKKPDEMGVTGGVSAEESAEEGSVGDETGTEEMVSDEASSEEILEKEVDEEVVEEKAEPETTEEKAEAEAPAEDVIEEKTETEAPAEVKEEASEPVKAETPEEPEASADSDEEDKEGEDSKKADS